MGLASALLFVLGLSAPHNRSQGIGGWELDTFRKKSIMLGLYIVPECHLTSRGLRPFATWGTTRHNLQPGKELRIGIERLNR